MPEDPLEKAQRFRDRAQDPRVRAKLDVFEQGRAELGLGKADRLPGPRVDVYPRKKGEPKERIAIFRAILSPPGGLWDQATIVVEGTLDLDETGRPILSRLTLKPLLQGEALSTEGLPSLPLKRILRKVFAKLAELPRWATLDVMVFGDSHPLTGEPWIGEKTEARRLAADAARKVRPRPREDDPDLMAARLYRSLLAAGRGRGIYGEMAAQMGLTKRQARYRIEQAVGKKYLTAAMGRGRAGRALGPRWPRETEGGSE